MKLACECSSLGCNATIDAPYEELVEARKDDKVVIATDCIHGPEQTDTLVAEKEGYRIYTQGV